MSSAPALSVIVPTRDRPDRLARCLAALERQTAASFEVVVVDDASRDSRAVAAAVATAPRARLLCGEGRGPAAARNAGARVALAPVLCFTDDDCRPAPGWLEALAGRIAAGAHAAAGPTRNARLAGAPAAAAQAITNHLMESTLHPATGRLRFAPTCNLACRAEILGALPFDERYPLAAGEDRDWCARLLAAGYALTYAPAAIVDHHQELSPRAFWRQQVRYGRGTHRFHRAGGPGLASPRFYAGLVRRGFAAGPGAGALVCAAQAATAVGMALEARERRASHADRRRGSKDRPR
ncbi:MAG: glycosyltransferase [Solirubrobacteraceae bacterium MAG38_C4-C5]|nr:glycosyltransferase [Candidatus Siliceabacter maunaloa]